MRYASGQLADVVVGPTGNLQPLTTVQFLVGAVAHPFAGNDIYVYYGQEQTQANAWTVGGVSGGWGNSAFNESCGLITSGANSELVNNNSGTSTNFNTNSTVCTANVQRVREITVGFWQDIYKGGTAQLAGMRSPVAERPASNSASLRFTSISTPRTCKSVTLKSD